MSDWRSELALITGGKKKSPVETALPVKEDAKKTAKSSRAKPPNGEFRHLGRQYFLQTVDRDAGLCRYDTKQERYSLFMKWDGEAWRVISPKTYKREIADSKWGAAKWGAMKSFEKMVMGARIPSEYRTPAKPLKGNAVTGVAFDECFEAAYDQWFKRFDTADEARRAVLELTRKAAKDRDALEGDPLFLMVLEEIKKKEANDKNFDVPKKLVTDPRALDMARAMLARDGKANLGSCEEAMAAERTYLAQPGCWK